MPPNKLMIFIFIYFPLRNLTRSYNLVHSGPSPTTKGCISQALKSQSQFQHQMPILRMLLYLAKTLYTLGWYTLIRLGWTKGEPFFYNLKER